MLIRTEKEKETAMNIEERLELELVLSPHPEKLLRSMLSKTMQAFTPRNFDQAEDFTSEWINSAAKHCALLMSLHVQDHPEESHACIHRFYKELPLGFQDMLKDHFTTLLEATGLPNPLTESETNAKTRAEAFTLLKEQTDG
jgi:hypothetical protein